MYPPAPGVDREAPEDMEYLGYKIPKGAIIAVGRFFLISVSVSLCLCVCVSVSLSLSLCLCVCLRVYVRFFFAYVPCS